jgi:hypothetical protein
LEPMEICFERKADSPSYYFFEKIIRKGQRLEEIFLRPR